MVLLALREFLGFVKYIHHELTNIEGGLSPTLDMGLVLPYTLLLVSWLQSLDGMSGEFTCTVSDNSASKTAE